MGIEKIVFKCDTRYDRPYYEQMNCLLSRGMTFTQTIPFEIVSEISEVLRCKSLKSGRYRHIKAEILNG
jgi:hypothetical protein